MSPFTPIQTERLRIRRFILDDWQAAFAYTSDPTVMHYLEERPMTEAQAQQFIAENLGEDAGHFAVDRCSDNRLVGHMSFHPWFGPRTFEIGWVMHPREHGRGYATEAAMALLRYGFESLRLHRVIATCQPENVASWRVMDRLGMRREAHFRKGHYHRGETWWDEYFYAMLEEDWFGTRTKKENEENQ